LQGVSGRSAASLPASSTWPSSGFLSLSFIACPVLPIWMISAGFAFFRYSLKRAVAVKSSGQPAYQLGGVVDHRHDAGIIEPRRPDHADNPHHLLRLIVIGRHDQ